MISGRFERNELPKPVDYFEREGVRLIGRGEWRSAICCFHDDSRPSLSVNVKTGKFRCWACGTHGSNVLDFHIARHGLSFARAARDLGAWRPA